MPLESAEVTRLFSAIEGDQFAAHLNAASGPEGAIAAGRSSAELQELVELIAETETAGPAVLRRIARVARLDTDPAYENPSDAALFGYLLALANAKSNLSGVAATAVLGARRLWWARALAVHVLKGVPQAVSTETKSSGEALGTNVAEHVRNVLTIRGLFANELEHIAWASEFMDMPLADPTAGNELIETDGSTSFLGSETVQIEFAA